MKTADQKLQEILALVAKYKLPDDEDALRENAFENGNFDDAFDSGVRQGERSLAQEIRNIAS